MTQDRLTFLSSLSPSESSTDLDQNGVLVHGVHIARHLVMVRVELVDVLAEVRFTRVLRADCSRCGKEREVSDQFSGLSGQWSTAETARPITA